MIDIIKLSGKQGSGKTTLANELLRIAASLGYDFFGTMKFADPLYEMHELILNKMEGFTGAPRTKKDGPLLQWLGTEFGRDRFGENVWVDVLKKRIMKLGGDDSAAVKTKRLIIIDDGRFENEFDAIPEALRVRLLCPEEIRKARADAWRDNTAHRSETGLDRYELDGKFDLYLDSHNVSVSDCATLIAAQLQKKSWVGKRK